MQNQTISGHIFIFLTEYSSRQEHRKNIFLLDTSPVEKILK